MRNLRIYTLNNAQFFRFNAQIARCAALTLSLLGLVDIQPSVHGSRHVQVGPTV